MPEKILMWGTSLLAEQVIENTGCEVSGFLDSNNTKWATFFNGRPVHEPSTELVASHGIVIASIYFYDIYRNILSLGGQPAQIRIANKNCILTAAESAALVEQHEAHQRWLASMQETQLSGVRNFGLDHEAHLRHAAEAATISGLVLEFGVFEGASLRILANACRQEVYGFDTFTGLPSDWTFFHQQNFFDLGGKLPLEGKNINLVRGLFEDTLEAFLREHPGAIRLLHCDADLYSSTSFVLKHCAKRLTPGSVIVFDDYLYDLDYERCDYRAATDFFAATHCEVEILSQDISGSVAMKVVSIRP